MNSGVNYYNKTFIGKKFGKLEIVELGSKHKYICKCDCGNTKEFNMYNVVKGKSKSCGCSKKNSKTPLDLTGNSYGRLNVLKKSKKTGSNYKKYWLCKCDCGVIVEVEQSQLRRGKTKSCGCLNRELSSKRMSGENNPMYGVRGEKCPNWNPNLTTEERIINRDTVENYHFKESVAKRDKRTCQCCGIKSTSKHKVSMHVHHIFNYTEYKELRYDVNNGIMLCKPCHVSFHKKYGYMNNNKHQLDEFIKENTEVINGTKEPLTP